MTVVTKYIADDGTEFDDEWDCRDYEFRQAFKFSGIEIYGKHNKRLNDPLSDETYSNSQKIIIHSQDALDILSKIVEYTGFIEWDDIIEPGIWKHKDDGEFRGHFFKVGEVNQK